ncbi:hypothetical protein ACFOG5_23675 [Pedobacter fastidiosus]|uniref:hypothetical protein n=1 Tax=Pedobacter fastidiosus TaxID=2765361 RepID=UPI00360C0564
MKLSSPIDDFLKKAVMDNRLFPSHISLFMAIFHHSKDDPKIEFLICRKKLMQYSRIKSIATYHKCLSDLVQAGYIDYKPSYNPLGSLIKFSIYPSQAL